MPRTFSALGERCFSVCGHRLWKALSPHLKDVESVNQFKFLLKTRFFKPACLGDLFLTAHTLHAQQHCYFLNFTSALVLKKTHTLSLYFYLHLRLRIFLKLASQVQFVVYQTFVACELVCYFCISLNWNCTVMRLWFATEKAIHKWLHYYYKPERKLAEFDYIDQTLQNK